MNSNDQKNSLSYQVWHKVVKVSTEIKKTEGINKKNIAFHSLYINSQSRNEYSCVWWINNDMTCDNHYWINFTLSHGHEIEVKRGSINAFNYEIKKFPFLYALGSIGAS